MLTNENQKVLPDFCLTNSNRPNAYFCSMKFFYALLALAFFTLAISCNNNASSPEEGGNSQSSSAPLLSYTVVATYPHDTSAFIQGLAFYKGKLYEGTGLNGSSKLKEVDLVSGKAHSSISLDSNLFGEGVTILNDTIYQLTWQNKVVLVYTAKDLKKIKEFPLSTDGWGITNDGKNLIVSDGSSNLYFYEPSTFRLLKTQGVTEMGSSSFNLNELEFIDGYIYANQWQYNYILKIDPNSGQVVSKLDLSDLVDRLKARFPGMDTEQQATLNGIAYNPETKKIYVTGKLWPELYEIQFQH